MIGLTLSRLILAENMAKRVRERRGIALSLAAFIAVDIGDGVIARKLGADTPLRRFADAAVDRASVARVAVATMRTNAAAKPYIAGLAAREVVVGATNALHHFRTGEVVQGHGPHKLGSLSVALFGLAAASGNQVATRGTGLAANIINAGLAADYVASAIEPQGYVAGGVRHIECEVFSNDRTPLAEKKSESEEHSSYRSIQYRPAPQHYGLSGYVSR